MSDYLRIVLPDGRTVGTGNRPYTGPPVARAPVPAAVPESEWQEFELECADIKIKDQNGYGACNGFAAATSLEWARWIAGMPHVDLSPWYVYAILCNGIDRGSSIAEALQLLSDRGTCPDKDVPYGVINPRRLSAEAQADARRFKIEIGARLSGFAELMTAAQLRRPFNFSVDAGGNFVRVDSEGVAGGRAGTGNHAVTGGLGAKRLRNGKWAIKAQNSWGPDVQAGGYFWFTADHIEGQRWFDAYLISAAEYDPEQAELPPAVPS